MLQVPNMTALAMLIALALDAAVGWPDALFRRIGHPVTWLGTLAARLDDRLNPASAPAGRALGALALGLVLSAALLPALAIAVLGPGGWAGAALQGALAAPLVAARSLHLHVAAVAGPLAAGDLAGARRAVAQIVGRDPSQLDQGGVGRAAIESLAENTSDGVTAPLFWGVLFGLPGIAAYKAVNTLDSMWGHRTPRHGRFGWAAARLDDALNLVPARLTGLSIALVSGRGAALGAMWRDAGRHRSPNAGWPEAAMAGALGVRLSGPRIYADRVAEEPWLNDGARDPAPTDLVRALGVYRRTVIAWAAGLTALAASL